MNLDILALGKKLPTNEAKISVAEQEKRRNRKAMADREKTFKLLKLIEIVM
jgi:hypothetical protein